MVRYFKATEISEEEYIAATGEDLGFWNACVSPENDGVYVALDEETESEFTIEISDFDELQSPEASS